MSRVVRVEDVSFSYVPRQPVLNHVNITFTAGTTAVIGQNGAGKTTLMKLLNGLLKPTEGQVYVGDFNTREHDPAFIAKYVGMVFQNPDDQIFKRTVLDEVMFGPMNLGLSESDAKARAENALETVGLSVARETNPFDLGYAERKQVCIASVLAMNTEVIVFDEPTVGQDARGLAAIGQLIRRLQAQEKTVIGIVHDMNFAVEYFDILVAMASGQVVQSGTADQVFGNHQTLQTSHLDQPAMAKLSAGLSLSQFHFTVDSIVNSLSSRQKST